MAVLKTIRVTVWLPTTTPAHYQACRESLEWLESKFPDGQTIAWSWPWRPGETLTGAALWHGTWRDLQTGKVDSDSHLMFVGHWPANTVASDEELCAVLDRIEKEIHATYARHYKTRKEVYQKVIFVEACAAQVVDVDVVQKQLSLL